MSFSVVSEIAIVPDSEARGIVSRLPALPRNLALLARFDRPIGWWLLFWPCAWGVWLTGTGLQPLLIGWLLLAPFLTPALVAAVFAAVAGVMVTVSLDALLPAARAAGGRAAALGGVLLGVAAMALSLDLLS